MAFSGSQKTAYKAVGLPGIVATFTAKAEAQPLVGLVSVTSATRDFSLTSGARDFSLTTITRDFTLTSKTR